MPGRLVFREGDGTLVFAEIDNRFAAGRIYLQGGQVTHFQPRGQESILWVSDRSRYEPGRAIRGGIPICWPWFGDHPSDPGKPAHGFARTAPWEVLGAGETEQQETFLRLGLRENGNTLAVWPHAFSLELHVLFGRRLSVSLCMTNSGDRPFTCTGALHSYFSVGDSGRVRILGLAGKEYLDKTDGFTRKKQAGPVAMDGETDRIYLEASEECFIEDPVLCRALSIDKRGSNTTVVWNPGPEKSAKIPDMTKNGYRGMLCVEAANAADDFIALAPGENHIIAAVVGIALPLSGARKPAARCPSKTKEGET
jgi:D-hexose-6-phosphate mutarotase